MFRPCSLLLALLALTAGFAEEPDPLAEASRLIAQLEQGEPDWEPLVRALGRCGSPAVPKIVSVFRDPAQAPRVRAGMLIALRWVGVQDSRVLPVLESALGESDELLVLTAAHELCELEGSGVPLLATTLESHPSALARTYAGVALAKTTYTLPEVVLPALHDALKDQEPTVRGAALLAYARSYNIYLEAEAAVPAMVELLADPDPDQRAAAVTALGLLSDTGLERGLADSSPNVRLAALWSLRQHCLNDYETALAFLPGVSRCLRDSDPKVREQAVLATRGFHTSEVVQCLPALLQIAMRPEDTANLYACQAVSRVVSLAEAEQISLWHVLPCALWRELLLLLAGVLGWFGLGRFLSRARTKGPARVLQAVVVGGAPVAAIWAYGASVLDRASDVDLEPFIPPVGFLWISPWIALGLTLSLLCAFATAWAVHLPPRKDRPLTGEAPTAKASPQR